MKIFTTLLYNVCLPLFVLFQSSLCIPRPLSGAEDTRIFYNVKGQIDLMCSVEESLANTDIEWYKNETNVKEINELKNRYSIDTTSEKKTSKFTIQKALNNDAGNYSCRLKDDQIVYEVAANVLVKLPSNSGVVEGEKLKLHCQSVGTKMHIRWTLPNNTKIGENMEHVDNRIKLSDENGVKRSILTINEISHSDAGKYTCEGVSELTDKVVASTTEVRVKDKFAALWPFIGICTEVFVLCVIILIYEKRRNKNVDLDESDTDVGANDQKNDNHKDIRQRK